MRKIFLFALAILFGVINLRAQGFTISGTQLKDANGNEFIMKGISIPLAWFKYKVNRNIKNIRENTGSNCLRIVVTTKTPDKVWQRCVQKCIDNKMVPMVELHDVTCKTSAGSILDMANFWASKASFLTKPEIARFILINIANEWGDWAMADKNQQAWFDAYKTAVTAMRNAGINTTIVIDAPGCGQDVRNGETLMNYAKNLQAKDPKHNLLFSVHMYCEWSVDGKSDASVALPAIKRAGIPVIVGEFGYQHDNNHGGICDISESSIINTCQSNSIGWLAWSWKGNNNPVSYLDLSYNWTGTKLSDWGKTVIEGPFGTKTSVIATVFKASDSAK
jgi:mannan endo-1,4-beta-mannosidase